MRSSAAQDNRRRSSPSRPDVNQRPANNNGQHRRPSPAGGRVDVPAARRPDLPASRSDLPAHPRAEYPGSRADILAGARAEVPGPRSGQQRVESPQRHRYQDPSPHRGARHQSPAGQISDQFSRPARRESPGRGRRRSQDLPRVPGGPEAAQPSCREDAAPKPIMLSSSDIILRPAVPQMPDHKPSRKQSLSSASAQIIMVALCNRGGIIFLPCSFFLSSSCSSIFFFLA